MILATCLTFLTIGVLIGLIAWLDLRFPFGEKYRIPKIIILLFSVLSGLYQIAFITHFTWIFYLIDATALAIVIRFYKPVWGQLKKYGKNFFALKTSANKISFYSLLIFLIYTFFLSIFSVPGWDWDSMIFHLPRPFLFLNEGTIFTTHFSDPRQTVWPAGGDILFYMFSRYGDTIGVGFISFIFYISTLVAVFDAVKEKMGSERAWTITLITASLPILIYTSNTVKGDGAAIFAYLMSWLFFKEWLEKKKSPDFYFLLITLALGLSLKLTFLFSIFFALLSFILILFWKNKNSELKIKISSPRAAIFIPFIVLGLILSQIPLFIYNKISYGSFLGPTVGLIHSMPFKMIFQNFFKFHIELIDFVIPLSHLGIPFVDTLLSTVYNATIGTWTHDTPWQFRYFPQEINASFGPFGFFLLALGLYKSIFSKNHFYRFFGLAGSIHILFIIFRFPREEAISIVRYFAPPLIAGIALLPQIYDSALLRHTKLCRAVCIFLLFFCPTINFAKPLLAYHPKAIPWYRFAFTDRDFLCKEKHFFDDRIEIYKNNVQPNDRILILSTENVWMYPYYKYAHHASVRLEQFRHLSKEWLSENLKNYSLVICEARFCAEQINSIPYLHSFWKSDPALPRPAAYYRTLVSK